ncbi:MAG: DinB family protein [Acidobacteria bacterium]|nr:DinB family protein [Acidobacteriota bacterium]
MANHPRPSLADLISQAEAVAAEVNESFAELTPHQLDWKPAPDRWSVAQCLDHLITANAGYFPIFDRILQGEKKKTFWESLPLLPSLWGKMLIRAVAPDSPRKAKAPAVFQPSSSDLGGDVVDRFLEQQDRLLAAMRAMEGLDLESVILTSPAAGFITYSLRDALEIVVPHERRHFQQALRVKALEGFPAA